VIPKKYPIFFKCVSIFILFTKRVNWDMPLDSMYLLKYIKFPVLLKYSQKNLFDSFAKINSQEKVDILRNSSKFHKIKRICPYEINVLYTHFFRKQLGY